MRFTTGHTMNPGMTFPVNESHSMTYQEEKCDWEIVTPADFHDSFNGYTCNLPVKKEDGYILEGDEHKLYEILTA